MGRKQVLPRHIAFIIDGNRRWAKKRKKPSFFGHRQGAETVKRTIELCLKKKIPFVTFWTLSTENLKERSPLELRFLFKLIEEIPKHIKNLEKDIKINLIGDLSALPKTSQKVLFELNKKTRENKGMVVILGVNYGGRDEIIRAVNRLLKNWKLAGRAGYGFAAGIGNLKVTEEMFSQCLDTSGIPDPDLIIRTGGRSRLSGFMPWQAVYSELYFTNILWPDFDEKELEKALLFFANTQRNFGK